MLRAWRSLEAITDEERSEAILWIRHLTTSDPTYFYANMLSLSGDLVSKGLLEPEKEIFLHDQLVSAINQALSNAENLRNIGLILAVGRLAVRELVHGDRNVGERIHRPAFAKLVAMAGGLQALNLPAAVYKHVLWADRVATHITGLNLTDVDSRVGDGFGRQATSSDLTMLNTYRPIRRRRNSV